MNEEDLALEQALLLAQQAQGSPQEQFSGSSFFQPPSPERQNVQQSDAVYYSQQLPNAPEPREALERRIDPRDLEQLSVQGYMIPNKASDIRSDDQGTYPVDVEGNRLDWVKRPGVLPVTTDQGELRAAMPYFLEQAGNLASGIVPVKGAGTILGSGPIRKAGQVAAEAAQPQPFDLFGTMAKVSPVSPEGNVLMRPSVSKFDLKGPETQTVESFLNQIKGMPGIPQETIDDIASRFGQSYPEAGLRQPVSKGDFEKLFPPSKYDKVDLKEAAGSPDQHFLTMAQEESFDNLDTIAHDMFANFGAGRYSTVDDAVDMISDIVYGSGSFDELPLEIREVLKSNGIENSSSLSSEFERLRERYVRSTADAYADAHYDDNRFGDTGYKYIEFQRLLPEQYYERHPDKYFEIGVVHPDQRGEYGHYRGFEDQYGRSLVGHVRGQFLPEGGTLLNSEAFKRQTGAPGASTSEKPSTVKAVPNSMVIEELQSDAQKSAGQSGPLSNVHATLFKTAIQHALENGAQTVYYPTAKTIAGPRHMEPKDFSSIYDKEVVKQGLNPLSKIPGVSMENLGGDYIKIDFTPDAIKYILKGPGQRLTNYKDGGKVSSYGYNPPKDDPIGDLLRSQSQEESDLLEKEIGILMSDERDTGDPITDLLQRQEDRAIPLKEPSGKSFATRAFETGLQSENIEDRRRLPANWNRKAEEAMRDRYGPLEGEIEAQFPRPTKRASGGSVDDKYASLDFSDVLPYKFG